MTKAVPDENLAAIGKILKQKQSYVTWTMKRFHIDYEKADSHFSEVLLKLLERNTNFSTLNINYIYGCINNLIIDKEIRHVNKIQYFEHLRFASNLADERSLSVIYSYKNVRKYIYDLNDNYKQYLILKFGFGMKQHEIAEFLDKSHGTVAPMIRTAQAALRHKLLKQLTL